MARATYLIVPLLWAIAPQLKIKFKAQALGTRVNSYMFVYADAFLWAQIPMSHDEL